MSSSRRLPNGSIEYNGEVWRAITSEQQGMPVYAKQKEYAIYKKLKKKSQSDYQCLYLQNQVQSLNNRHGFVKSLVSKFHVKQHVLNLEGGELHYQIDNGRAFVTDIKVDPNHSYKNKRSASGVYEVRYRDRSWQVNERKPTVSHEHIAINGACDGMEEAAKFLPALIERGYKPDTTQDDLKNSGYAMFYNPCGKGIKAHMKQVADSSGAGKGTQAAQQLKALILQQAKKDKELSWTVHEKGHAVFKRALQAINKAGVNPKLKSQLAKQQVFYANPTMNMSLVDKYRKKVGMQLAPNPPLLNSWSLEQTWVTGNFASETHISMRQISELGENGNRNRTYGHVATNAIGRMALPAAGTFTLPTGLSVGAIGWAATLAGITMSNLGGNSNQKVIEGTADYFNDVISKYRQMS